MTPTVVLVTGSAPPDVCGVGDYTASLAEALRKAGLPVELLCHRDWSVSGTIAAFRGMIRRKNAIIHLQYPTMGYGHSIGPQLLALVKPCVVTLHEFTLAHGLRKLSLFPFTVRSQRLVMTAEAEKRALVHRFPWIESRIQIIPIGSNIPECAEVKPERTNTIANFGMIMPRKGLEDFIELVRLLREKNCSWNAEIIGRVARGHEAYAAKLMESSRPHSVQWVLDRSLGEVSEMLCHAGIGYFPFPDGASDRRGSLRAACMAGLPCITTTSDLTPPNLADVVRFAATPLQAAEMIEQLIDSAAERDRLSKSAREYANSFTWDKIALSHIRLYRELDSTRS